MEISVELEGEDKLISGGTEIEDVSKLCVHGAHLSARGHCALWFKCQKL